MLKFLKRWGFGGRKTFFKKFLFPKNHFTLLYTGMPLVVTVNLPDSTGSPVK